FSSANKKPEYVKSVEKKEDKKADEKKRDMSKVKCYNYKKEGHFAKDCKKAKVKGYNYYKIKMLLAKKDSDEQVLLAEDQAWMESSSDSDQEINANKVFMAQIEKVLSDLDESSSSAEETIFEEQNNEFNEQMKVLNEKNIDLLAQMEVLQDQLKVKHVVIDTHTDCQAQYAKLEEERYEYMIRYSALCANDKQHRKKIDEQEILFDKTNFEKIDSPFQRTSSLKPYVPTVILEKIIIDLEDEVVSLLEKEKANLETIESLKSKDFKSSENAISE
nr:hypothetical protein [Tanacetum cinerariifolium]